MANRRIEIPIEASTSCTSYFLLEYNFDGSPGYAYSEQQFETPLVANNLIDGALYKFRITRFCCDGTSSDPLTFTLDTTPTDAPVNFVLTQDGADVDATWDAVSGATGYELERDSNSDFSTATQIYSGATNSYTDVAPGAGTWYYRVRATKTGFAASAWTEDSIIVT